MPARPHILIVEDDREISLLVARYLQANDCRASVAINGHTIDRALGNSRYDLVVLDLDLSGADGLEICHRLRAAGSLIPIVMLAGKADETDRIIGLEMGADDYLVKPFNPRELLARIKAVLRRSAATPVAADGHAGVLAFRGWLLDLRHRALFSPAGTKVALTGAEFELLCTLCEHCGRVLSRDELVELTQGRTVGPFERSVDVLISRLRAKIERTPHEPELIRTIRCRGYLFTPPVERQ